LKARCIDREREWNVVDHGTRECRGGAVGNWWERNFDMLEVAKKFTELKYSLDNIIMILNSQVEKKDDLIL